MIKITAKGLAKFMTNNAAGQRAVLRDFKFPRSPEARAQTVYYSEARRAIRQYHEDDNNAATQSKVVADLSTKLTQANGPARARLGHNLRALQGYFRVFGSNEFRILNSPLLRYVHGNVAVNAYPDLFVVEDGRETLIKIDLSAEPTHENLIRIILQVMYEASVAAGLKVLPRDVVYLDLSRGIEHRGARVRTRLSREIHAACENISALWDGITKRGIRVSSTHASERTIRHVGPTVSD